MKGRDTNAISIFRRLLVFCRQWRAVVSCGNRLSGCAVARWMGQVCVHWFQVGRHYPGTCVVQDSVHGSGGLQNFLGAGEDTF